MSASTYTSTVYRLRAGAPMPVGQGTFVLHTFMSEKSSIENFLCATQLPSSADFRGQGGDLVSANFSRLKNEGGGELFQGRQVHQPEFVEEGDY